MVEDHKKPFALDAWTYGGGSEVLHELLQEEDPWTTEEVKQERRAERERVIERGGKAVGLQLCQVLAHWMDSHLKVPPYVALTPAEIHQLVDESAFGLLDHECLCIYDKSEQRETPSGSIRGIFEKDNYEWLFARSSALDEDWISGEAGVHESKGFSKKNFVEVLRPFADAGIPVVIMPQLHGMGLVIDVGYSHLYDRVVVRVAIGRNEHDARLTVTSPTWDPRAPVALFDEQGTCLVPFDERLVEHRDYSFLRETGLLDGSFERELVQVLRQVQWNTPEGRNYGVQLELLQDRKDPSKMYLVQLRPTPTALRGMNTLPKLEGKLIATSLKISKTFDVTGQVLAKQRDRYSWGGEEPMSYGRDLDAEAVQKVWYLQEGLQRFREAHGGKICLWTDWPDKYVWPYEVLGLARLGAAVQIGEMLFSNFAHGRFSWREMADRVPYIQAFHAHENGRTIQLHRSDIHRLHMLLRDKPDAQLRVVSDGLVGQIYMLDN